MDRKRPRRAAANNSALTACSDYGALSATSRFAKEEDDEDDDDDDYKFDAMLGRRLASVDLITAERRPLDLERCG